MGVTGERSELGSDVASVVERIRQCTDMPVCVGIGVSTPEQAARVCEVADGVVVGSALVRRLLEGSGPDGAAAFISSMRKAIDWRTLSRGAPLPGRRQPRSWLSTVSAIAR